MCDDISSIIRENRKTAVLVTHDLAEAVSAADRVLILTRRPGRIKTVLPLHLQSRLSAAGEKKRHRKFSKDILIRCGKLLKTGRCPMNNRETLAQRTFVAAETLQEKDCSRTHPSLFRFSGSLGAERRDRTAG